MKFIMFTKHLEALDLPGIMSALKSVGVEGADLCVRPGYPVNPLNTETALPEAVRQFADEGLSVPLVTTPSEFTRPDIDYAERLYAACGEAGVRHIKLGDWEWSSASSYWDEVEKIRGYLEGFQRLSERHGVQTVLHNHSGALMSLNACSIMNLVKGFDPKYVGVFADPGHFSICGEPIEMALDIVRAHLSLMAFKDMVRHRVVQDGKTAWQPDVVPLGHGLVDWRAVLEALKGLAFDGLVSMHALYGGEPAETVIDLSRIDLRFIKGLLEEI